MRQKNKAKTLVFLAVLLVALLSTVHFAKADTLLIEQTNHNNTSGDYYYLFQTFKLTETKAITRVHFNLYTDVAITFTVTIRTTDVTGDGPPSQPATPTSTILASNTTTYHTGGWELDEFIFSTPPVATANVLYAIVVQGSTTTWNRYVNTGDLYVPGNSGRSSDGSLWTENTFSGTRVDLAFRVYGQAADSTPPVCGSISANTTVAGQPFKLTSLIYDETAVDKVIYSSNRTGSWTNETAIQGSGTDYYANFTDTWPSTVGTMVQVKTYANDTNNNWGSSYLYNFTLTAPTPTSTPPPETTPSPTPIVTPRVIEVPNEPITLYFRSDTYSTVGVAGYGLDTDHTNTAASVADSMAAVGSVTYGFRVWLVTSNVSQSEITSGTPVGQITLNANATGLETADWNCPATNVVLGYQALKVTVYMDYAGSGWIARATYLSGVLVTGHIVASTWTFKLYCNYTEDGSNTYATFSWDSNNYKSGIYNVIFTKPVESELQWWRLASGDALGFIIGGFADILGIEVVYALLLLGIGGSLYRRYNHAGTVAFFFVIFGGVGGLIIPFVPVWGALFLAVIVIVSVTFIVWRLIR